MLRILFGISNIRYAAAKMHEIAFENLLKTISKAFEGNLLHYQQYQFNIVLMSQ